MQKLLQNFNLGRFSRLALSFCLVMVMAMGVSWGQAPVGTTLWGETWTGGDANETPSAYGFEGTTVYGGATLTYAQSSTNTKLYEEALAGGSSPELLLSKSNQTWTISNIPTGQATKMSLTFKSNKTTFDVTSTTTGITISGSQKSWTIEATSSVTTFNLTIKNTGSSNARIDDIELNVVTAGTGGDTPQPTTYTITYDCNGGTSGCPDNVSNITAGTSITLASAPSKTDYTFDGWNVGTTTYEAGSAYTVNGDVTMTAQWTENTTPTPGGITATLNIQAYAGANNWTNGIQYTSATVAPVTFTANGGGNTGKYYSNGQDWRFYQNESASITISVAEGYTLVSVTPTYSVSNNGVLKNGNTTVTSGTIVSVSGTSVTFTVGNNGTATNGQVRFTSIDVVYVSNGSTQTASDFAIINQSTDLTFDLYNNTTAQVINYTTSSTGAITITPAQSDYFTYVHDAAEKTVTVTPTAVTPSAQTVTISQEADDDYYAGAATFTVSVVNSDPNVPGSQNNPYTVAQARAAIDAGTGTQGVYATGIVSAIPTAWNSQHSNITFNFVDEEGDANFLQAYRCVSGTDVDASEVAVGDIVVVYGNLTKYQSTYEFGQGCELVSLTHPIHDVETPTFSPVAGTYATAQDVTISCATAGSTIHYTTDGTEPTSASAQYSTPISVPTTTTIKAIAYVGDVESTVATATYHINSQDNPYTVAQALAFNEYPANGIYVSGIVSTAPTQAPTNYGELTYYISDDGTATNQLEVYKGKDLEQASFTAQDDIQVGDIVTVYGNVQVYNSTIEFGTGNYLVSFVRPASTEPSVTVTPNTITASAAGEVGSLALTYENITDFISFDYYFCNSTGVEIFDTDPNYPDWIDAEIDEDNDGYSLTYLIDENTGDARTAYIKVYTLDDNEEEVGAIVTVNQVQYVVDYATLPFEWEGGASADFNALNGITTNGLGSDYASGNAPYLIKLDGTGDYIQVKCDQQPGKVTIGVKMIGGASTSTITVQGSADGTTFTDVQTLTISGSQNDVLTLETTNSFATNDRYVKLLFTKGSNVGVGPITIAVVDNTPSITVTPATVNVDAGEHDGTLDLTYESLTITDMTDFGIQFYDENNNEIATVNEPDWIIVDVAEQDPNVGEGYVVSYYISDNDGAARTKYFKVYAMDDETNLVYSNLVTINQVAAPQQYTLTIGNPANVTITAGYGTDGVLSNGENASILNGTEISLTANVAQGYVFGGFTVTDSDNNEITLAENNGVYSFVMPSSNVTVNASASEVTTTTYTLATSITSGKQYIFVGKDNNVYYAMGADKGNNRYGIVISVNEGIASAVVDNTNANAHEFTISSLATEGVYSIEDATTLGGYLYAASSSNNYLKTESSLDQNGNGNWSITIDSETGQASIIANGSNARKYMRFNNAQDLFACYGSISDQHPIFLYEKVEAEEIEYRISYVTNGVEIEETVALGGTSVNLPSATASVADWTFAGWSDSYICETQTTPEMVPNPYNVSDNVVLYAVYNNGTSYSSHPNNAVCQIVIDNDNPSYTETFEGYSTTTTYWTETKPSCWSLIWIEAPRQPHRRAQVVYEPFYANNNYYLRMDSLNIYAMPPVNVDINTLQLELYVRQPFASHQLQVGVLEENSDGSYVFVPVNTINNQSAYLEYRTVDFSEYNGSGHRIAFRNVYSDGDYGLKSFNYIDDITISRITDNNCSITELPYTENFDEITTETTERTGVGMDCWTVAEKDYNYTDAYAPQLCHASYYAHSGAYTLLLDGRGIYAMPKLNVEDVTVQDLEMEFYVRQYSASCQLQVGVMSDLNDPSSFVVMKTVGNDGVSGQQRHVVDFSAYEGEGKYIAFRNVYNGTWGRSPQYIDDIDLHVKVEDNCGITSLPYTENFDEITAVTAERTGEQPECWTLVKKDYNYTDNYAQQLCHAAFYAHSGSYSLLLDGRGIYAMPELKVDINIHEMQLEFYVRQYSANCHLQVGVLSDVNNPSTFVALETITNEGASGQVQHVVDFSQYANSIPAGAKYIAFRNVYDGSWGRSINYLDDITLSLATSTPDAVAEMPQTQGEEPEEYVDDSANTDFEEVMAPTGISDFDLSNLTVYPNPTTGMVTIVAEEVSRVEVYNQIGVLVARYTNEQVIDLGNLSSGIYVLRVTTPQGVAIRKVVKK